MGQTLTTSSLVPTDTPLKDVLDRYLADVAKTLKPGDRVEVPLPGQTVLDGESAARVARECSSASTARGDFPQGVTCTVADGKVVLERAAEYVAVFAKGKEFFLQVCKGIVMNVAVDPHTAGAFAAALKKGEPCQYVFPGLFKSSTMDYKDGFITLTVGSICKMTFPATGVAAALEKAFSSPPPKVVDTVVDTDVVDTIVVDTVVDTDVVDTVVGTGVIDSDVIDVELGRKD